MRIIFNHDEYLISLIITGIDNLRREHLIEQFLSASLYVSKRGAY